MSESIFEQPTPEEQPFLDAICTQPADLCLRLVFADWLDERADPRGEWLRAAIEIERAIEGLGWGFAFRHWRPFARKLLEQDSTAQAAFETCAAFKTPDWSAHPTLLRQSTSGRWYCGGFIENVSIGRLPLKTFGDELRRTVPLRGIESLSGAPDPEDLTRAGRHLWRGIERIVDHSRRPRQGFAPFVSVARARAFADATHDVRALATGPLFQPEALAAYLNVNPIESLYLEMHSKIADRQLERLFALWQPENLRCLGLQGLPRHTRTISGLAEWPGLQAVRLLDLANVPLGERACQALVDSPYARPNLCVVYPSSSSRSPAPRDEGIVWFDSHGTQLPQAGHFNLYDW